MRKTVSISSLPRAAAIGVMALLFAVTGQQASATSATSEACTTVSNLADASRTPQDVDVQSPAPPAGFNISWSIPADMPRDVLTAHCVHKRHVETGTEAETCIYLHPQATETGWDSCYGNYPNSVCYRGVHRLKVKFKTNCGFELPYSDSVDYRYGTYRP